MIIKNFVAIYTSWAVLVIAVTPRWENESQAEDHITVVHICSCSSMTLLNISWPEVSNIDQMDFDFYNLQFKIDGHMLHNLTTKETSYIHGMMLADDINSVTNVQVNITAFNKCKECSMPLDKLIAELPLNKGKNLIKIDHSYTASSNLGTYMKA